MGVEAEAVSDELEEESVILVFASSSRITFVLLLSQVKKERNKSEIGKISVRNKCFRNELSNIK